MFNFDFLIEATTILLTGVGGPLGGTGPPPPVGGIITENSIQIDSESGVDLVIE